jgi:hypothetical protein
LAAAGAMAGVSRRALDDDVRMPLRVRGLLD